MGWIGVDLDGTLAFYNELVLEEIGSPIPPMLERVKAWIANGTDVRIFTARASVPELIPSVRAWCFEHLGCELPVTNVKDFACVAIYDDRANRVSYNQGLVNWCETCVREAV